MNDELIKTYDAGGAIGEHKIVKAGSADRTVVQAVAADVPFGVSGRGAVASGGRVEVIRSGIAKVKYGGNVTRGALLASDANGDAVAAGDNTTDGIIGIAEISGVDNDIGEVLIQISRGNKST